VWPLCLENVSIPGLVQFRFAIGGHDVIIVQRDIVMAHTGGEQERAEQGGENALQNSLEQRRQACPRAAARVAREKGPQHLN